MVPSLVNREDVVIAYFSHQLLLISLSSDEQADPVGEAHRAELAGNES